MVVCFRGDPKALSVVMDMSNQTRAVELLILNDRVFALLIEI